MSINCLLYTSDAADDTPCVGIRATPIAESMVALVLIDHLLRNRGQNADVKSEVPEIPSKG